MPDNAEIVAGVAFLLTLLAGIGRAVRESRKPKPESATPEDRSHMDNEALWVLIESLRATNKAQQTELSESNRLNAELRSYLDQANTRGDRLEGRLAKLQAEVDTLKGQ